MDNNIIEVAGIPDYLLKLIDKRVHQKGSDRAGYVRELIEKDIFGVSQRQKQFEVFSGKQRTFDEVNAVPKGNLQKSVDLEKWEADMKSITSEAEKIPVLPPCAFTRESIYENHD